MHVSDTSKGSSRQSNRDGAAAVVTHDGNNMVITGRIVHRVVWAEDGRVSKGDQVGVSRVHKGHKSWSVLGHVDNGVGADIAVCDSSISHNRKQRPIVAWIMNGPVCSVGKEIRE